jgi:hypothetical protein
MTVFAAKDEMAYSRLLRVMLVTRVHEVDCISDGEASQCNVSAKIFSY